MKNQRLLIALLCASLIISISSLVISIIALNSPYAQDELPKPILTEEISQQPEVLTLPEDTLAPAQKDEQPAEQAPKTKPAQKVIVEKEPQAEEPVSTIIDNDSFVDLGLPSGTQWKARNEEGLLNFEEATMKYKKQLPDIKQWEELKKYCEWEWVNNGYKVTGQNGVSIFMPAAGYRNFSGQIGQVGTYGNYWSSTPKDKNEAWRFGFEPDKFSITTHSRNYGRSIRLVRAGTKN